MHTTQQHQLLKFFREHIGFLPSNYICMRKVVTISIYSYNMPVWAIQEAKALLPKFNYQVMNWVSIQLRMKRKSI